jgi:hypothetical protein
MGYNTDFSGSFKITPSLSETDLAFVEKFVEGGPSYAKDRGWPKAPNSWCQWIPDPSGNFLRWDGGEKFYLYTEWLEYLIKNLLAPRGYSLNGFVTWDGEESGDVGKIEVVNNHITVKPGAIVYEEYEPKSIPRKFSSEFYDVEIDEEGAKVTPKGKYMAAMQIGLDVMDGTAILKGESSGVVGIVEAHFDYNGNYMGLSFRRIK